jgi:hypothetical protein
MTSIYERATRELFANLNTNQTVSLSFLEISGDNCNDLLNKFNSVQLLTGHDGSFHAYPLIEPVVSSVEELMAFIKYGCGVRATAATGLFPALHDIYEPL